MLKKLSKRNAKKQILDYIIYIITMVITVALILSFNMIIFSDEISTIIKEKSILPLMIVMVSIIVVFTMSVLVNYITIFILKRRSREFGIYMLLGIENEDIAKLFINENRSIYGFILVIGNFFGLCFFQGIKALVYRMYAVPYIFSIEISIKAIILTILYLGIILCFTSVRIKRIIKRLTVRELLYLDKLSIIGKEAGVQDNILLTILSAILGIMGGIIIIWSVASKVPDFLLVFAVTFLAFAIYSLFVFIYKYLLSHLKNDRWKYYNNHLFIYRQLTSKMGSMLFLITGASMLIVLTLLSISWSIYILDKIDRRVDAVAFDVAFFADNENADFSPYLSYLTECHELDSSYEYILGTNHADNFCQQAKKAVQGKFGYYISSSDEDIFISASDYNNLRDMLNLPSVNINDGNYIVHCTETSIIPLKLYTEQNPFVLIGDTKYQFGGIYSEPFMQQESKGNGDCVLIVIPDKAFSYLDYFTNILVINTKNSLSLSEIEDMEKINSSVSMISKTGVRNKSASMAVYTVLPLFYLAFVLCAIACTILSIQILSEAHSEIKNYQILSYLGIDIKQQKKMLKDQLFIFFFLPVIPAILINLLVFPMMSGSIVKDSNGIFQIISLFSEFKKVVIAASCLLLFLILYFNATFILYKRIVIKNESDKIDMKE